MKRHITQEQVEKYVWWYFLGWCGADLLYTALYVRSWWAFVLVTILSTIAGSIGEIMLRAWLETRKCNYCNLPDQYRYLCNSCTDEKDEEHA